MLNVSSGDLHQEKNIFKLSPSKNVHMVFHMAYHVKYHMEYHMNYHVKYHMVFHVAIWPGIPHGKPCEKKILILKVPRMKNQN